MVSRELIEDIMKTLRLPNNLRSGTVTQNCSTCLFWTDGWCRCPSSNVHSTEFWQLCDSHRDKQSSNF